MSSSWLSLGIKLVSANWILFDQPAVAIEIFRVTHFYADAPNYGARALISQFFNDDLDPLISAIVYPNRREKQIIEIKIPDSLKEQSNYSRNLGIKIASFGRENTYYSDWRIGIEAYNGN
jgi:hypothetical protein